MLELFKRTVFAGIGAAVITKDRIESMLQEMVEQGKITRDEASRMADKIAAEGREEFERTREEISNNFSRMFKRERFVKLEDFQNLQLRVSRLEERAAGRDLNEVSERKAAESSASLSPDVSPDSP